MVRRPKAVGEGTFMLAPNLSPVGGAGNYRPPPLNPLVVQTNSTKRKAEHSYPYYQHLPKLIKKKPKIFPPPPDTSRLPSWEAVCLCSLGTSLGISAGSKASGWRSHQTSGGEGPRPIGFHNFHHSHATDMISYSDFYNVLKECPLSLWMTTSNTASRDRKAYLENLCVEASVTPWINWEEQGLFCLVCSVTSWLSKSDLHSLSSRQQQVMASSPTSSQCQQKVVLK